MNENQNQEEMKIMDLEEDETVEVLNEETTEITDTDPSEDEDVEILEIGDNSEETKAPLLSSKKEGIILIVIVVVITLIAVFLIPNISTLLNGKGGYVISKEKNEIKNNGTVDGYLEIGNTEGSITAKKIQFYSFMKKSNNVLKFKYLPETTMNSIDDLNIYIELYNSKKNAIYRTKFVPTGKVERKIIENVDLALNENIYGEATYAKVTILDDNSFNISDNSITCTLNEVNDIYTLNTTIVYNMSTNGLTGYKVTRNLIVNPNFTHSKSEENDPNLIISKEGEMLSKYGLDTLEYSNTDITYSVDLLKNTIEGEKFSIGSTSRQIKLESEKNKWRCE